MERILTYAELLKLKRWNTPTIYNGWEMITRHDTTKGHFNLRQTTDYMPQMGSMIGYAVTVVCEPSNPDHAKSQTAWSEYRRYVASIPGPKIVVVQDLDAPHVGAFWGEVNSNVHRALGCVGTITDGCIRDVDEMNNAGFKALAAGTCVGHAFSTPVRWGVDVEVFGCPVHPGDLIHADKHGFLVIPPEDQKGLLYAANFMDANECERQIGVSRKLTGLSAEEMLKRIDEGCAEFSRAAQEKFSRKGEF